MDEIKLIEPTALYEADLLAFRDECIKEDIVVHGDGGLSTTDSFENWLKYLFDMKRKETVPDGMVPSKTFIAVRTSSNDVIGIINIRLELNDTLLIRGGNIGYSIRPRYRMQGYGTKMLELALFKCHSYGMKKVLLTCRKTNIASAKTILKLAGKEEITKQSQAGSFRRFWIKTKGEKNEKSIFLRNKRT